MKRLFNIQKIVSILLMIFLIGNLGTPAYAAASSTKSNIISTPSDISSAIDAYNDLEPDAKIIFLKSLSTNQELLNFHLTYVDEDFTISSEDSPSYNNLAKSTSNILNVLSNNLSPLGLPTAVLYSLQAMGAAMVAAIADGPLPIGDILLAAVTASTLIILANNWSTVKPLWNSIVNAFANAFTTSVSNVISAFGNIKTESEEISRIVIPTISVSGKTVNVSTSQYYCQTRASDLTENQKRQGVYYVAVLYQGDVWVDANKPLNISQGKTIIYANNSLVGVWANSQSDARGVAGGNFAKWHNIHDSAAGYYFHYHHRQFDKSHAWYF